MDTYTHVQLLDERAAVEKLPSVESSVEVKDDRQEGKAVAV
jgi:hypothetical protein